MDISNTLLTPEQVGGILKVTPRTVKNLLRDGTLKGSKVGRFWRIQPQDLNDYIEGDVRGAFCIVVGELCDPSWISDKKNRDYTRRIAGRLWNSNIDLPPPTRDDLGYVTKRTYNNYGQGARAILDLLDAIDTPPPR